MTSSICLFYSEIAHLYKSFELFLYQLFLIHVGWNCYVGDISSRLFLASIHFSLLIFVIQFKRITREKFKLFVLTVATLGPYLIILWT